VFIDDLEIIKNIFKYLVLWEVRRRVTTPANIPPTETFIIYKRPSSHGADDYIVNADYPMETCI
jgi:hypothetical protein